MTRDGKINFYRKLWHLFSGLFIIAVMLLSYPSKGAALVVLAVFSAALLVLDILRFATPAGNRFFWKHLGFLTSDKEKRGPNTSFYYAASLLICVLIYPPRITMGAIVCLAVGDPAAGVSGALIGKHRIRGKSIEGAVVNFIICLGLIRFLIPSSTVAIAGALAGALIELISLPGLDDNLTVPLFAGLVMTLAAHFQPY
ncbi:MAG: hypothetical protein JXB45_10840 [Candidatus Krumholzibacteriota bacterium]|nr:hypothetical protein [Candidatus Krumholzibacteriota bacterium]